MECLKHVYKLCLEKFNVHMKNFDCGNIHELSECSDGEYYNHQAGESLFGMYNWKTSFITGLAPLYYRTEKNNKYIIWANSMKTDYRKKVFQNGLNTMHDLGFLYSPYSVAMYQLTGDGEHRECALKAADELIKRFDINGKYIDAWRRMDDDSRQGRAIIDCMINIQLLFWAWKDSGCTTYRDIAIAHAQTTSKYFIREDDSICHSFDFDRKTGEVARENNGCGYSNGSYWARGAAWSIYGYAMTARYLDSEEYYVLATKLLDRYLAELKGNSLVPVWDFRLPLNKPAKMCTNKDSADWDEGDTANIIYNVDSSACAIITCALLELNSIHNSEKYMSIAEASLKELCSETYFNANKNESAILARSNGNMSYTSFGDYFFVQALQRFLYDTETCW